MPYEYCFRKTGDGCPDAIVPSTKPLDDKSNVRYKVVYVDVDVSNKSDRQEWGHVKYQSVYKPDEAFEITLQWMQSTGSMVADLVKQNV